MTFELNDEIVEQATVGCLKETYINTYNTLRSTLIDNDLTGVHSFDFDEEIFELIKDLRALEHIIKTMFGGTLIYSVDKLLLELNEEMYIQGNTIGELKIQNQNLVRDNNQLGYELNELKDKIKNILG